MTAPNRQSDKFAEDLYLLVMSPAVRERIDALGRKHGLDRATLKLEIMRYAEAFIRWADNRPCSVVVACERAASDDRQDRAEAGPSGVRPSAPSRRQRPKKDPRCRTRGLAVGSECLGCKAEEFCRQVA